MIAITSCDYSREENDSRNLTPETRKLPPIREVKIGNQVWMAENLNLITFRNGDPIPVAKTDMEWVSYAESKLPAWCFSYNDSTNGVVYGVLYNWYAMMDPRGLAPQGWHIPSSSEWDTLIASLGGSNYAGSKMKTKLGWYSNGNGSNSSGFSALPGGSRDSDGYFWWLSESCEFWSSNNQKGRMAEGFSLHFFIQDVHRVADEKGSGRSIRCVKD
jgi:uncharacterized protein (TIGR02145 family)